MTLHFQQSTWHPGEAELQKLLRVPPTTNPTSAGLPKNYAYRVVQSPLVAFGALDAEGRPWVTVWGGEAGFAQPVGHGVLSANSLADARHDPVLQALFGLPDGLGNRTGEYQITREELEGGRGKLMAGLSIDLAMRDRVKLAGRLVAGRVGGGMGAGGQGGVRSESDADSVVRVQMAMLVEESLGNCPKYLNKKTIRPCVPSPRLVSENTPLPREALELLNKADLFFLSSTNGEGMDVNHRGGPPGFIRLVSNKSDEDGVNLCYPEYSGNRFYQTLGNMHIRPLVGMVVPDFETGDVLYLTGETKILMGAAANRVLTHTKLAIRVHVTAARFVQSSLPFRGDVVDYSPYNPPVRRLAAETASSFSAPEQADPAATEPPAVATLVHREMITPALARFTFSLRMARPLKKWHPGQHVTLDFSSELDIGYSHMRDDDPRSLNDDFVRTFTISNGAPSPSVDGGGGNDDYVDDYVTDGTRLEITAKKHGPVTGLLWTHHLRVPLEVPVLGFGGEASFRLANNNNESQRAGDEVRPVFVAGGVGITPLLAQAPALLARGRDFDVLWSLRAGDLPLAEDTFRRVPELAARTRLFVTGTNAEEAEEGRVLATMADRLRELGSLVRRLKEGRITREDLVGEDEAAGGAARRGKKFYLCTGSAMVKTLLKWLEGEDVVYETFEY